MELPKKGASRENLLQQLDQISAQDTNWRTAHMFAYIYRVDDEVINFGKEAYAKFQTENGLSPFAFPSLRKFETEVVAMTASMLNGGTEAAGCMTSGGTESILMAMKAVRDWARDKFPHIQVPEVIAPTSAHPAWDKACHYLGLKMVHTPVDDGFRADVDAMRAAMTPNTVLLIGSAPTYPHGMVDPIDKMGELAQEKGIWLHVDACVGGFVLPFQRAGGYPTPPFDFAVPGVLSMSADVHKYGYAPKGASIVLYRNADLRKYQFYAYTEWSGGVYATPALAGGRTGGAVAAAWSVMKFLGEEGYVKQVSRMMETTRRMIDRINEFPELRVLGKPDSTLFAIASDELNIFALGDELKKLGWIIEPMHMPAALHVTVSPKHDEVMDALMKDMRTAIDKVKTMPETDVSEAAALYGMMGTLPDRKMAHDLVLEYLNGLYQVETT